jgi:hypothetical protein
MRSTTEILLCARVTGHIHIAVGVRDTGRLPTIAYLSSNLIATTAVSGRHFPSVAAGEPSRWLPLRPAADPKQKYEAARTGWASCLSVRESSTVGAARARVELVRTEAMGLLCIAVVPDRRNPLLAAGWPAEATG